MGPGTRRRSASPRTHHAVTANHSTAVKLPGIAGTTFINTIATLTNTPIIAMGTPSRVLWRRARAMNARHAAHQPIAPTAVPTSLIGTSTASPREAAAAVGNAPQADSGNRGAKPGRDPPHAGGGPSR